MLLLAALLIPHVAVANPQERDPPEPIRRWYDVRDVLSASRWDPENLVDMRPHLSSAWIHLIHEHRLLTHDGGATLELSDLLECVRGALWANPEAEVDEIEGHAGRVVLVANETAHAVAARTIEVLREATAEAITVDVYRLDDDRIPRTTGSHLGAEEASRFVASAPGSLVARERVRFGAPATIADAEWTTVLYDYDSEVAQFVSSYDPIVTVVPSGIEIAVQVDRAADGRQFVVRTWGRDGAIDGKPRRLELESMGNAPIELPRVQTSLWTASAILEPGGALVVDHDGGGRSALMVRVAADGKVPAENENVLPLGELGLTHMRLGLPDLGVAEPSGGLPVKEVTSPFEEPPWGYEVPPSIFVLDALKRVLDEGSASVLGARALVFGPSPGQDEIRAGIDAARKELRIGTIEVDVRYDLVPLTELAGVLDGGPAAFAAAAGERLLGSVVENDSLLLVGGVEWAYLHDYDIQVAQSAIVGDPIIHGVFEGIALWCAPFRTPEGRVSSWFDVRAQRSDEMLRGLATSITVLDEEERESPPGPLGTYEERLWIELPVTHRASVRTRVEAREGEWALVAARHVAETDEALVVVARMGER
ncbi:MAG: hypothetical protein AAGB93_05350 [Planctomycetota bacterium]